jgi:hypothetical protein
LQNSSCIFSAFFLNIADLVKHFKEKYQDLTIRKIIGNKEKILQAIEDEADGKRANLKGAKHFKLKKALLNWLKNVRSHALIL